MKTDLIAGLLSLVALMVIGALYAFTGHEIVSRDLEVALGAFVIAALTRWRWSRVKKPPHTLPASPPTPTLAELLSEAKTPEDGAQESKTETQDADDDDGDDIFEESKTPPRKDD